MVVGTLAVCALAGGAVLSQVVTSSPPDSSPGPGGDATSPLARSSAWTREATPVLGAIELELQRTDTVRRRWDASAPAQWAGPPPGAVVALLERDAALTHHRDTLRAAMAAVRREPASEPVLASAWQQLRAAHDVLRTLASGRGGLGETVEAAVLRLIRDEGVPVRDVADRTSGRGSRTATPVVAARDTAAGEPAAKNADEATSVIPVAAEAVGPPVERPATVAASTRSVSDVIARPLLVDEASAGPESAEPPPGDGPASEAPTPSQPDASDVPETMGDPLPTRSMLTFDNTSTGDETSGPRSETTADDEPTTPSDTQSSTDAGASSNQPSATDR